MGAQKNPLTETVLLNTHNKYFDRQINEKTHTLSLLYRGLMTLSNFGVLFEWPLKTGFTVCYKGIALYNPQAAPIRVVQVIHFVH